MLNGYVSSSFFYRSIDCWNLLSLRLKESKSLIIFKHNLKSVDLTHLLNGFEYVVINVIIVRARRIYWIVSLLSCTLMQLINLIN